jgi:hypothetical protein
MKLVELSLYEVSELLGHFSQAALVGREDHEDVENHRRFKYAAGRNYETCRRVCRNHTDEIAEMRKKPAPIQEYENKMQLLMATHAKRKENGDIDFIEQDNRQIYQFSAEGEVSVQAGMIALDAEYADALRDFASGESRIIRWMKEKRVEIPVYTFPWSQLPEKMAGGYMAAISIMIDGIPTECEKPLSNGLDTDCQSQQE